MAEGEKVTIRVTLHGRHTGTFMGVPATGKEVSNPGLAIFKLENGKIVAAHLETDRLGFLEQIGAVPQNVGLGPRPSPAAAAR